MSRLLRKFARTCTCDQGFSWKDYFRGKIFQRNMAVLSSFLLHSCNGITLTMGNLTVYTMSYIKEYVDSGIASETSWTVSMYVAFYCVGILLAETSQKFVSKRWISIISASVFVSAMVVSYFTLKISVFALTVTIGAICGTAGGALGLVALQLVFPWIDKDKSFVTAVIRSASAVNAFVMNYLVTWLINSEDRLPNVNTSSLSYFSQKKILDRVPYVFLYLGILNCVLLMVGCALIREKKEDTDGPKINGVDVKENNSSKNRTVSSHLIDQSNSDSILRRSDICDPFKNLDINLIEKRGAGGKSQSYEENMMEENVNSSHNQICNQTCSSHQLNSERTKTVTHSLGSTSKQCLGTDDSENGSKVNITDYSPREVPVEALTYLQILKIKSFYTGLFILSILAFQYILTLKYYKLFGQISIKNDHFLTNLGVVLSISLVIFRPLWGYAISRLGIKNALVFAFALESLMFSWLFLTPLPSRWVYCVGMYILWNTANGYPIFAPALPLELYGEKSFGKAYGLQATVLTVVNIMTPVVIQIVLENFSWFILFSGSAILGSVGLFVIVFFLPRIHTY